MRDPGDANSQVASVLAARDIVGLVDLVVSVVAGAVGEQSDGGRTAIDDSEACEIAGGWRFVGGKRTACCN